jgi:hypothetical protein
MHRSRTLPPVLCALLIAPACAGTRQSAPEADGAAEAAEAAEADGGVAREVAHFTRIAASGPLEVQVELGAGPAVVAAPDAELVAEVAGSTLRLSLPEGARGAARSAVRVSAPHIDALSCSKGASARLEGLEGGRIELFLEGAGSIRASGSVERLEARIDGSGALDLDGLQTREADVSVRGSGRAQVSVSGALEAEVDGHGSVVYRGDPIVWAGGSGAGNVSRR